MSVLTKPLMGVAIFCAMAHSAPADDVASVVSREFKGTRLNELALWNLGSDRTFEVFTTDFGGKAGAYRADTLEPLWERKLEGGGLTAPVIGDFMGIGAPIFACASEKGDVYFLWPGTGEVISSLSTDLEFSVAPAIAKRGDGDELILADDKGFVVGFRLDGATGLPRETFRVVNTAPDDTAFSVVGKPAQPPSCLDMDGDGSPEIVVSSVTGFLQVISLPPNPGQAPRRVHTRLAQNTKATTLAWVGAFAAGGENLFVYGIGTSLQFFKWNPGSDDVRQKISQVMQAPGYGNTLGHLVAGEINSDSALDIVSTADSTVAARYFGRDLSGNDALLDIAAQHLGTQRAPFAPAAMVTLKNGNRAVVAVDASGTAYVWEPSSTDNVSTRFSGVPVPTTFAPAGDVTGSGKLAMVIWNEKDFTLSVATLPVDVDPQATGPMLTLGVNFSRTGQWGTAWQQEWDERMAKAASALAAAKAMPGGDKDDAGITTDAVSMRAGMDPTDSAMGILAIDRNGGKSGFNLSFLLLALLVLGAGAAVFLVKRRN